MGYGENGSVIGPINTPTSSVASGVWSLGEVAEAVRDSIWPGPAVDGMTYIAKAVMDGTSYTVSFASVPQTYRHLRLVMSQGRRAGTGGGSVYLQYNSNTTAGDYGYNVQWTAGQSSVAAANSSSNLITLDNFTPINRASYAVWEIGNYSDSSVGTTTLVQAGMDPKGGHPSSFVSTSSTGFGVASAVTTVAVQTNGSGSSLYWEAPTTFTLYGIGTAA